MSNNEYGVEIPQEQIPDSEVQQEQVVETPVAVEIPVEAPAEAAVEAPAEAPVAVPSPKPVGKLKYGFKVAPAGKKVIGILGMVFSIVAAAMLIFSYKNTMEMPIAEIPYWSFATSLTEQGDDLSDLQEEMKVNAEDLQEWLEDNQADLEEDYSDASVALLENYLNSQAGIGECFSIKNYKEYLRYYNELVEDPISDELDFDIRVVGGISDMEVIGKVWNAISMVILVLAVLCAALVFFGGFFRITALVCVGLGISMLYNLIFCGFVMLLACLALQIVLIVFSAIVNKGYKKYRQELKAAA